ncbi:MAG: luciferase family protein [Candidatus Sulfotelmatobacter sp.]
MVKYLDSPAPFWRSGIPGRRRGGWTRPYGRIVDIPFPRSIRDALLAEGLAEEHRWVPGSGWVTFRMRSEEDLGQALWLMRLSYLRYTLKTSSDPHKLLEQESEELHLRPRFKSLLEPFVPKTPTSFD